MKILIINLLRLGDTIMTVPVINGLHERRSDSQIDLLTFKPVASLHAMIPHVRRWWTLDREELQDGLGRADMPILSSYSVLQEQLDVINAEKYDLIINLTQTKFSAYIAGYLKSADRLGLTYDLKGLPHFYSPWFRYLDDRADGEVDDVFHHTDIFAHACGLGNSQLDWSMKVTEKGEAEVKSLDLGAGEVIVLQLFTSDEKKNWPLEKWIEFAKTIKAERPFTRIVALGSPAERSKLIEFVQAADSDVVPAILSLEGALALLSRAQVLVTGDTSIKHLANAGRAKVIELCIGWSDSRRTGIYKEDSLILQGVIQAATVKSLVCAILNDDWNSIEATASQFKADLKIERSRELSSGFWFAQDLTEPNSERLVTTLVERCAWKITLNRERQKKFSEFGSEGIALRRELRTLISGQSEGPVLAHLDFLEKQEEDRSLAVNSELVTLRREKPIRADLLDIAGFRKKQIELEFTFQHLEHKTKLIRTLKSNWTENL
jgi:ADP-heptose:LPS heptosyltransferase